MKTVLFGAAGAGALMLAACGTYTGGDGSMEVAGGTNADGEEIICRTETVTGSRLRGRRICQTEAEWEAYRQAMRDEVDRGRFEQQGDLQRNQSANPF